MKFVSVSVVVTVTGMPIELFIETTTDTFDPVKPLVSLSQTLGRNCT